MDTTLGIVWDTIAQEFADVPDAREATRVCLRLVLAVLLAGVLGYERERRDAAAGLRTHMLVGLGAALFVVAPQQAGLTNDEVSRVLQGVISGIGFLGAGVILKLDAQVRIRGVTTAASIWATAAIGVAAGLGRAVTAMIATLLALVILSLLLRLERRWDDAERRAPNDS